MKVVSGAWQKVVMANYAIDPAILFPLLPGGTRLSLYNERCFITLAGFVFSDISVFGVNLPFHHIVPEINLRFYVVPRNGNPTEKGVVFIRELIPKSMIGRAANFFYHEHYKVEDVRHSWMSQGGIEVVRYTWGEGNELGATASGSASTNIESGSVEDYILHNFYGYSGEQRYRVAHPQWRLRDVSQYRVAVDFGKSFGEQFEFLNNAEPHSVFLTDGSEVTIEQRVAYSTAV